MGSLSVYFYKVYFLFRLISGKCLTIITSISWYSAC